MSFVSNGTANHGWLKQEYRGPAHVNVGESALGAYSQYWRRDIYGYVTEEGGVRDWGTGLFGRKITEMSPWGSATKETLGNGHIAVSSYLAATGQMDGRCIGTACTVVGLTYAYDGWGNLIAQNQSGGAPGAHETFKYDALHRLIEADRVQPDLPAVTYEYDPSGNLKAKSDYSQSTPGAYQYPAVGTPGARPHAVTGLTLSTGMPLTFDYDGNGNQTARHTSSGLNRAVGYDIHNRPERLRIKALADPGLRVGDTWFRYAPSGERYLQRVRRSEGSAVEDLTFYPFAGYELVGNTPAFGTGFTFQKTRQHLGGWGIRTSEYSADFPSLIWLHTDRLGSTVAKTTQGGLMVVANSHGHHDRHGYDPFGKVRLSDWSDQWGAGTGANAQAPGAGGKLRSPVTPRGFTGHEHLEGENYAYQLIHMNGRVFDPLLGRFLGVDPIIQFPENSQSLNPYSYILNNPMAGTDPTGYCVAETGSHIKTCLKVTQEFSNGSFHVESFNKRNAADMARPQGMALSGLSSNGSSGVGTTGQAAVAATRADNTKAATPGMGQFTAPINRVEASLSLNAQSDDGVNEDDSFVPLADTLSRKYGSHRPWYHKYGGEGEGDWAICKQGQEFCSRQRGYESLKYFAYPGQDNSQPVWDGKISEVFFAGSSAGHIQTRLEPETFSTYNRTLDDHIFHDGYVRRSLVWRDDTLYLHTFGEGNNQNFYRWMRNTTLWRPGFNQYNEQFRQRMIQSWLGEQP